jgi:hypothetical protein
MHNGSRKSNIMYQFGEFQEYQIWVMQCANGTILVPRGKKLFVPR